MAGDNRAMRLDTTTLEACPRDPLTLRCQRCGIVNQHTRAELRRHGEKNTLQQALRRLTEACDYRRLYPYRPCEATFDGFALPALTIPAFVEPAAAAYWTALHHGEHETFARAAAEAVWRHEHPDSEPETDRLLTLTIARSRAPTGKLWEEAGRW